MKAVKLIEVTESNCGDDYACGKCYSVMYGDEEYCPCCGTYNDPTNVKVMTEKQLLAKCK